MIRRTAMPTLGAVLSLAVAGCNYVGDATAFDPQDLDRSPGWVAVREVPIVLQKDRTDCGAAALSMVLAYWQITLSPEDVKRTCPVIEDLGIKAKDLRDLARERGLQAFLIHGRWEDLEVELRRKHPVIVGLVKPYLSGARTHYEVSSPFILNERSSSPTIRATGGVRTPSKGSAGNGSPQDS